jgi:glutamate racemase
VLGCTHYPLLKKVIDDVTHKTLILIDSGVATADVVRATLEENNIRNKSTLKSNLQFYVSDLPFKFAEIGERFLGRKLGKINRATGFEF